MRPHPANDKLREAEFFLMLMEKHFDTDEFRYFLNAIPCGPPQLQGT